MQFLKRRVRFSTRLLFGPGGSEGPRVGGDGHVSQNFNLCLNDAELNAKHFCGSWRLRGRVVRVELRGKGDKFTYINKKIN